MKYEKVHWLRLHREDPYQGSDVPLNLYRALLYFPSQGLDASLVPADAMLKLSIEWVGEGGGGRIPWAKWSL